MGRGRGRVGERVGGRVGGWGGREGGRERGREGGRDREVGILWREKASKQLRMCPFLLKKDAQ